MKIRAIMQGWYEGVSISIQDRNKNNGRLSIVKELTLEEIPEGSMINETANISRESAQELMDDLYSIGIRPTDAAGTAGGMKATENHLNDMRKIVSKKLDVASSRGCCMVLAPDFMSL